MFRYVEVLCYTYILRHGSCYGNLFFYPHGALFWVFPAEVLAFRFAVRQV